MKTIDQIYRDNLDILRRRYGSVAALADKLGKSSSQVSQWINASVDGKSGKPRTMKPATAREIELLIGEKEGWMDQDRSGSGSIEITPNTGAEIAITGRVPVISWVAAGDWCEVADPYPIGSAEDWLPCATKHGKRTYALRVDGDSMTSPYPGQKSYPHGVIIFVDPDRAAINGSRVIARLPNSDKATFKTYSEDAGRRYLRPINPQYPTIEINDETHICGVVIGKWEDE